MIGIKVSDEEYEELKRLAIPYMEPEDTVNDGIRKVIREMLGMKVDAEERTVENVLSGIPKPYWYLAEELVEELKNQISVETRLPSANAWADGDRWVTIKKMNPRSRRENVGSIHPRRFGFVAYIYDPTKGKEVDFKVGKDVRITEGKFDESQQFIEPLTEEEVKSGAEYRDVKNKILSAFWKAYEGL